VQLLNASGCLDALTAPETVAMLDAFVTKTVTPEPRTGNAPVRIAETELGMLNAIGLANPGRERFVADVLPRLQELGKPIWVSVGGFTARDYAQTCEQLGRDAVASIELNLSCPNVDEAPESAAEIVAACREVAANPLYAKLSPHSWDIGESVRAVEAEALAERAEHVNRVAWLERREGTCPRTDRVEQEPELAAGSKAERHRARQHAAGRLKHEELARNPGIDAAALETDERVGPERLDRDDSTTLARRPRHRCAPGARGRSRPGRWRSRAPRPWRRRWS